MVANFPLFIDGNGVTSEAVNTVTAGAHTVSETSDSGYTATIGGDCTSEGAITLVAGQDATCTITNNDIAPQLHLRKVISGGSATAADFTLTANGTGANDISGTSPVDSGAGLLADTFALSETSPAGYLASDWVCVGGTQNGSNITVGLNQSATCTITNTYDSPTLTVTKTVTNDNGGTKVVANFPLFIDGNGVTSEAVNTVTAGAHTVSETSDSGYTATIGGDCTSEGAITLVAGQDATCTITNNDIAPTLKLVKVVSNTHGGNKTSVDWLLTAGGTGGFSEAGNSTTFHSVKANEAHALSESAVSGYDTGSWSCDGGTLVGSSVTLGLAENVTCTITNNDSAPASASTNSSTSNDCIAPMITTVPTIIKSTRTGPTSIFISWGPYAGIDTFNIRYGPANGNWLYNTNVIGFSTTINDLPSYQPIWIQVAAKNSCFIGIYGESRFVGGPKLPNTGNMYILLNII